MTSTRLPAPPVASTSPIGRLTAPIQDVWDAWFGALYYPFTCLIFLLIVIFNWWYGRKLADDWEQWTIAEWLINYAAGFVRRGLSGEAVIALSRATGWPANLTAFTTFVGVFAAFFVLFAVLLFQRRMTFWYFALCLSPAFVLFTFYNSAAVGRKESLIYVAFTAWALAEGRVRRGLATHAAFAALAFVLTLMHEVFFFFTPYYPLLAYVAGGGERDARWWRALAVPVASAAAIALIVSASGSLHQQAICDRVIALGAPPKVCEGVLEYQEMPVAEAFRGFVTSLDGERLTALGLGFAIVLLPFYLFLTANAPRSLSPVRLTYAAAVIVLFSLPLFAMAIDWGRWISIHFILLTILAASLLPRSFPAAIHILRTHRTLRTLVLFSAGALVLASQLTWSLKYCCGAMILEPMGPIETLQGTWEELAGEFDL